MKFFSVMFLGLIFSSGAFACSCEEQSAAEMIKNSPYLFLAVPSAASAPIDARGLKMKTKLSVIKNFKNMRGTVVSIQTDYDGGANCGMEFKKDDGIYLIQAYKDGSNFATDSCSITYVDSAEGIKILREVNELTQK